MTFKKYIRRLIKSALYIIGIGINSTLLFERCFVLFKMNYVQLMFYKYFLYIFVYCIYMFYYCETYVIISIVLSRNIIIVVFYIIIEILRNIIIATIILCEQEIFYFNKHIPVLKASLILEMLCK